MVDFKMKAGFISFTLLLLIHANVQVCSALRTPEACSPSKEHGKLVICCRPGEAKSLLKSFKRVSARFPAAEANHTEVYEGNNRSAVEASYKQSQSKFFWMALLPWQRYQQTEIALDPFRESCLGVTVPDEGSSGTIWSLEDKAADALYVISYAVGVMLFLGSRKLSRNVLFYYGTGISVGILASTLILCIILSRLVPGKKLGAALIVGGFSTLLSALQYAWRRGVAQLSECCYEYVAVYVGIAGLLSFAALYWRGPVSDPRSLDLIGWTIQLVAAAVIYWAAQIHEVAVGTVVLLLLVRTSHVFAPVLNALKSFWRKRFPPRPQLLTQEEYEQQASIATRQALAELRQYCRSPECDAWKVVSRLQSPSRFASFVEGTSFHVSDSELLLYNSEGESISQPELTDDEADDGGANDFRLADSGQ